MDITKSVVTIMNSCTFSDTIFQFRLCDLNVGKGLKQKPFVGLAVKTRFSWIYP